MPDRCSSTYTPLAVALFAALCAAPAEAGTIAEILSPNVYTVSAGGQFTIRGILSFPDAATYTYGTCSTCTPANQNEFLFGYSPTSPHLGIVAGSVISSANFVGSQPYFQDIFGLGGWLGPTTVQGPLTTGVNDWRTFIMPANIAPGLYTYSYGVIFSQDDFFASGGIAFATNLEVNVVAPEPAAPILAALGLAVFLACKRKPHAAGS